MSFDEITAWGFVLVGLILAASGVRSTFYFGEHRRALKDSWVISAFHRTVITITTVCLWLTLARALQLTFGALPYISLISGVAIIWLLLIPQFLVRLFVSHEGRTEIEKGDPVNRNEDGQTLVEYGLLLALIAVIVIAALLFLGPVVADLFSNVGIRIGPGAPPSP
jgi:pilus assembly protein Flp/PilA